MRLPSSRTPGMRVYIHDRQHWKISGAYIDLSGLISKDRVLQKPPRSESGRYRRVPPRHLEAIGRRLGVGSDDCTPPLGSLDRSIVSIGPFLRRLVPRVSVAFRFQTFLDFCLTLAEQSCRAVLLIWHYTPAYLDCIMKLFPSAMLDNSDALKSDLSWLTITRTRGESRTLNWSLSRAHLRGYTLLVSLCPFSLFLSSTRKQHLYAMPIARGTF